MKKYAIRISKGENFLGYMDHFVSTSSEPRETFNTVTDAVAAIVSGVRQYPHLTRNDWYEIIGVEITTAVREIPLRTL